MRMEILICMFFFNSRGNTGVQTLDILILSTPMEVGNSMGTIKELNVLPLLKNTSPKTETLSSGGIFRSTVDLLEEVVRRLMIVMLKP
nr:AC4 protein [Malvaviscus yellow mosaic virus]